MCVMLIFRMRNFMKKSNKLIYLVMVFYIVLFSFKTVVLADNGGVSCDSWGDLKNDIQNAFNFLKVVVPLLVIGLSTYDFIKAVAAKDNKDVKKAFQRLLKRFLYAILLFFLPTLINYLLDLAGTNTKICEWMS